MEFSTSLENKIEQLKKRRLKTTLGQIAFRSPLILAPMAGICNIPFRLLMQDLGAGGTVSELVSCHGINHGNQRTLDMLKIDPREDIVGLQLFGEEPKAMARAARVAQDYGPNFLDINMGCPVRKVVTKGGGSALLKNPQELAKLFSAIKKEISIPLSIKIRTGWDAEGKNAEKIIHVAKEEGIEWVAIHGRTRAQQYTGFADWVYIESLAKDSPVSLIGNGDLHTPAVVRRRLNKTQCSALMIARGCLRNPFIFLESLDSSSTSIFTGRDYWEICQRLALYTDEVFTQQKVKLNQFRKLVVWFASGFSGAAKFRSQLFAAQGFDQALELTQNYYLTLEDSAKHIDTTTAFLQGGHG